MSNDKFNHVFFYTFFNLFLFLTKVSLCLLLFSKYRLRRKIPAKGRLTVFPRINWVKINLVFFLTFWNINTSQIFSFSLLVFQYSSLNWSLCAIFIFCWGNMDSQLMEKSKTYPSEATIILSTNQRWDMSDELRVDYLLKLHATGNCIYFTLHKHKLCLIIELVYKEVVLVSFLISK